MANSQQPAALLHSFRFRLRFRYPTANRRTKREQNQAGLDYAEQGGGKAYKVGLTAVTRSSL